MLNPPEQRTRRPADRPRPARPRRGQCAGRMKTGPAMGGDRPDLEKVSPRPQIGVGLFGHRLVVVGQHRPPVRVNG